MTDSMSGTNSVQGDYRNGDGHPFATLPTDPHAESIIVQLDGQVHSVAAADWDTILTDGMRCDWLNATSLLFVVGAVTDWPPEPRQNAIQFLADLQSQKPSVRFVAHAGGPPGNLFDSYVALLVGPDDPHRATQALEDAETVIALTLPHAISIACNTVIARLRQLGIRGQRLDWMQQRVQRRVEDLSATPIAAATNRPTVRSVLPDAPVPESVVVPAGWNLTADGITRASAMEGSTFPCPIVIERRLTAIETPNESIEVAWFREGEWRREIVSRGVVAQSKRIVELAEVGFPVTSNTAADLVQYIADFESANIGVLPEARVSNHLGWLGTTGQHGFLFGRTHIATPCPATNVVVPALSSQSSMDTITFRGADNGDEQVVDGFHATGTLEGWLAAMAPISNFPRVQFALYASLSPPLLKILGSPNFIFSLAGPTSGGKTTAQRVAASPWGCTDERSRSSAIYTWDASRVFLERAMAVLDSLPLIVDDTKRARSKDDIAHVIYDATSGRGRGRGSQLGIAGTGVWHTVLISSGEAPLASFTQEGGTRARVLESWGSPFGDACQETARLICELNDRLAEHYGHTGPLFVSFLLANRNRWNELCEWYRHVVAQYQARAGNNAVASRMAAHFAVLEIAAHITHQAIQLPWAYQGTVANLWDELTADTGEADRAATALRHVIGWCYSNRDDFQTELHEPSPRSAPLRGWAGRWRVEDRETGSTTLAVYVHRLDELLQAGGFETAAIRRQWQDRGWLRTSQGKSTLKVRCGDGVAEMVAIQWEAIDALIGPADDLPVVSAPRGIVGSGARDCA